MTPIAISASELNQFPSPTQGRDVIVQDLAAKMPQVMPDKSSRVSSAHNLVLSWFLIRTEVEGSSRIRFSVQIIGGALKKAKIEPWE
ncbi:hypothetical protein FPOAC2_04504 [Fusarium poae]|uniref:hypothetical protein n=1 Tax=Fusarium poae TaxID=36050 RepID=UPI001CEAE96F|nr:hypothetical protein FPOAC1_004420 [Fusarium poae]KAG8671181.1 hypothetical protein FPOAC1_004420 [Fusarium poae]